MNFKHQIIEKLTVSKFFSIPEVYKIYKKLYDYYGKQNWWPADSEFEVIVGTILTQNTAWRNVEKAIDNLKKENLLSLKKIANLPMPRLTKLIRPSGFYKVKAKRLKALLDFLMKNYSGDINKIKKQNLTTLRRQLLDVYGVGEETADSILLYALAKPAFVVDTYTRRIFSRHGHFNFDVPYSTVQSLLMKNLPKSIKVYNEYHALLVRLAKDYCRTKPICDNCPIRRL